MKKRLLMGLAGVTLSLFLCSCGVIGPQRVHMQIQAEEIAAGIVNCVRSILPITAGSESYSNERYNGSDGYALYSGNYTYDSGDDWFDPITRRYSRFSIDFHDYVSYLYGITIDSGTLNVYGDNSSTSMYLGELVIEGTVKVAGTWYDEEIRDTVTVYLDCNWSGVINEDSTLANGLESWWVLGVY